MKFLLAIAFFILMSLWVEEAYSKEKSSKKGKGKKKQYLCPSERGSERGNTSKRSVRGRSRLPMEQGARCGARSQDPGTMT